MSFKRIAYQKTVVVESENVFYLPELLDNEVNDMIGRGWEPLGGPVYYKSTSTHPSRHILIQVMVSNPAEL